MKALKSPPKYGLKSFKCISDLPAGIQEDINSLIDEGWRSRHIKSTIDERHGNKGHKLPSMGSLARYIIYYLEAQTGQDTTKQKEQELVYGLNEDMTKLKEITANPDLLKIDKRQILEGVIRKAIDRIQEVERIQKGRSTASNESSIAKYLGVLKDAIETLAKYEGEMPADDAVIVNIVDTNVQTLLRIFHKVIQELAPEKTKEFQSRLKEELDLYKREIAIEKTRQGVNA